MIVLDFIEKIDNVTRVDADMLRRNNQATAAELHRYLSVIANRSTLKNSRGKSYEALCTRSQSTRFT